ncbi:hypothetical protein P3W85_27365 [Cupriavidus basilensis]|uniref:Uncharacterized protein n=1 Tax=Cupriavidus basilensis TaxID=68895 RepID=A0ABT6AVJ9_9BURK|nr:hypothetical protein [Cupriavidus basilensis]MDF3836647.1 hypothetical protein [Cupriavidus basilensis]
MVIFSELKMRIGLIFRLLILIVIVVLLVPYGCDALNRSAARECKRESVGAYIGEICYLPSEYGTLFRLYDALSGELMAERTYKHPGPKIIWGDDSVIYDTSGSDESGYVKLPPTRWDWMRARLP